MTSSERAALLATFLVLLAGGTALAEAPAEVGWHGEELPQGLVRSEVEGEYLWSRDGSIMVYVPPGPFPMGSEDGDPDEKPVHEVEVSAYYIDKTEVSWGQWKRSGLELSEDPSSRYPVARAPDWGIVDDQPVLNVSWKDAVQYLTWAGKRLPTEAEWEKAARGVDGRTYPWGNETPTFDHAIWKEHPLALESTAPVDSFAGGSSPYGALHMAGNVYEWCQDVYDARFYETSPRKDPVAMEGSPYRVLRGGAFVLDLEDLRSALRYRLLPIDRAPYIGFRGVVAAPR